MYLYVCEFEGFAVAWFCKKPTAKKPQELWV